ncbi:TlpA family protein disulfide reductase [Undibacterium sp. SXout7W]|uniref:TlpA family protein disulfide reductase n=1 Tax=Undibacterium sp. SXout7W TaxID=3413049 RepID=UPI003BF1959B
MHTHNSKVTTPDNLSRLSKNSFILASLVLLTFTCLSARAIESGQPAVDFSLPGNKGNIQLSDYKGKIVYLDFWASWCGPCKQSFPWMNAMQTKFQAQGVKIIAVNLDTNKEDAKRFLDSVPGNFDIAYDPKGTLPRQYEVKGMPTSVLIDRDGKVVAQHIGFNDAARGKIEQMIQTLAGVKP